MQKQEQEPDPLGQAVWDYFYEGKAEKIAVFSDEAEDDYMQAEHLFRSYEKMPFQEKAFLDYCTGSVLDVGAGAGPHSLYLQAQGFSVCSIDISPLCCKVMQARGLINVRNENIFTLKGSWDTILFPMNGLGIAGNRENLHKLFLHLASLLANEGQILFDWTDLSQLYMEADFPGNGVFHYTMRYKKIIGKSFPWIYLSFEECRSQACSAGFNLELLVSDSDTGAWTGRLIRA